MDDDSGDSEEDEGEEGWLRQGWRSKTGSYYQFYRLEKYGPKQFDIYFNSDANPVSCRAKF